MKFVQVCPVQPVNGSCPEPLIWVEAGSSLPLTYAEFAQLVPALVGILLTAWGVKMLVRQIFNR